MRKAPPIPLASFTDYFRGFDLVQAVRDVFGDETEEVLGRLKVGFISSKYMYMGVSDQDGNLRVGTYHLKNSDLRTLYLDIVHELFHVKQFMKNKDYFSREHQKYVKKGFDASLYYGSPIEVPAYRHTVNEAKRIGMKYDEIAEYLKMGPVEPKVFSKLLKDVGLEKGMVAGTREKLSVEIRRGASVPLFPFTDYFKGFESVPAVRELLGAEAGRFLSALRIEFAGMPIRAVMPDEDDGHLQISPMYLRSGDARLLYFDVLLCLNLLKRLREGGAAGQMSRRRVSKALFESCAAAINEGRRVGLSDSELSSHLTVMRFQMSPGEFKRAMKKLFSTA